MNKTVKCPYCGDSTSLSTDNPYRPFCTERCKLIDLGDWASGKHTIPGEPGEAPSEPHQSEET